MRIGIVNDTLMAVEALRRVVASVSDYEVAWIARDGEQAVSLCGADTPDLVLMDLVMPKLDGAQATRQIMKKSPCPILVVTASIKGNSSKVFEAMGYGALDVVSTPALGAQGKPGAAQVLLSKIARVASLTGQPASVSKGKSAHRTPKIQPKIPLSYIPPLVAIGASTGGPHALTTVLSSLPAGFRAAIVIIQHVDLQFARGLADWLNCQTPLDVQLAAEGSRLEAGKVYLAASNDHLAIDANLTLQYTSEPNDYPYRPSVDVFFESVAQHWPRRGAAVLMTGMGRDGAKGMSSLRARGWHTIAQDEATCIVYGMPKAAVELDAVAAVLPLNEIAQTLSKGLIARR